MHAMPRVILHTISVGPVATRDSRGFSVLLSTLKRRSAESPTPQDLVPPVPPNRRLRLNRGIATRDFDVHATLALANPDMPMHDGPLDSAACELTSQDSPRSLRDFEEQIKSSILFLLKSSPLPTFVLCNSVPTQPKVTIPPELLSLSDSFRELLEHSPCARPSTFTNPQRAEVFQVLCTRSHNNSDLSLLRLATETSIRPALTCTVRTTQITLGKTRTRV
jgi:hypothetical protein